MVTLGLALILSTTYAHSKQQLSSLAVDVTARDIYFLTTLEDHLNQKAD